MSNRRSTMWTFGARFAVTGSTRTVWLPREPAGVRGSRRVPTAGRSEACRIRSRRCSTAARSVRSACSSRSSRSRDRPNRRLRFQRIRLAVAGCAEHARRRACSPWNWSSHVYSNDVSSIQPSRKRRFTANSTVLVVGVVRRIGRIGEEALVRACRPACRTASRCASSRIAENAVGPAIGERHRHGLGVHAREVDLRPLVAQVLVDVGDACRQAFAQLLLEVRRRPRRRTGASRFGSTVTKPPPPSVGDEVAELRRAVEQAVPVQIALWSPSPCRDELVAQLGKADRVLIVGDDVGRVEVEAAKEALDHRFAVAAQVVGEAGARADRGRF